MGISTMMLILAPPLVAADVFSRLSYLEQQNAQLRRSLSVQAVKISQQQGEIQNLQGQIEVLNHHLEWLTKLQKEMKLDLKERLHEVQQAQQAQTEKMSTPSDTTPSLASSPEPDTALFEEMDDDKQAYQLVFEQVKTGNYESAIAGLKDFLKNYPQSELANEAQYWLGEMYYSQKKFNLALTAFSTLLEKYPNSPKKSEALLKIGYVYYEKKDHATARAMFEQVMETYPGTIIADLAEKRLQELSE
jgi:tol-pal system protein YbgF